MKLPREKIQNITPENTIVDKVVEKCSLKKLTLHSSKTGEMMVHGYQVRSYLIGIIEEVGLDEGKRKE